MAGQAAKMAAFSGHFAAVTLVLWLASTLYAMPRTVARDAPPITSSTHDALRARAAMAAMYAARNKLSADKYLSEWKSGRTNNKSVHTNRASHVTVTMGQQPLRYQILTAAFLFFGCLPRTALYFPSLRPGYSHTCGQFGSPH
jgi:hypothetical protein